VRAHEFYLRGRQLIRNISTADWLQAPAMFRRAIELDPEYAQAHAGLADILAQLMLWRFAPATDLLAEAKRAAHPRARAGARPGRSARRARAPALARGNIEGATQSFERALELNPELYRGLLLLRARTPWRRASTRAPPNCSCRRSIGARRLHTCCPLAVSELDAQGEHERALEVARKAVAGLRHQAETDPGDARVHYMRRACWRASGGRRKAAPHRGGARAAAGRLRDALQQPPATTASPGTPSARSTCWSAPWCGRGQLGLVGARRRPRSAARSSRASSAAAKLNVAARAQTRIGS
jgi:tetratricopeptide (TPR) repeat protein